MPTNLCHQIMKHTMTFPSLDIASKHISSMLVEALEVCMGLGMVLESGEAR